MPLYKLLPHEFITHTSHSLDDQRVARINFDLSAQAIDHVLEHCIIHLARIAPHPLIEFLGRHSVPRTIDQMI
jgi:hypothetical protein